MIKIIGILISSCSKRYKDITKACHSINAEVIIISDDYNAEGLKWAAKESLCSFATGYTKFVRKNDLANGKKYEESQRYDDHVAAEERIFDFLVERSVDLLLVDDFEQEITEDFIQKFGSDKIVDVESLKSYLTESIEHHLAPI